MSAIKVQNDSINSRLFLDGHVYYLTFYHENSIPPFDPANSSRLLFRLYHTEDLNIDELDFADLSRYPRFEIMGIDGCSVSRGMREYNCLVRPLFEKLGRVA